MRSLRRVPDVKQREFTEFYRSDQAACLRAVLVSVGDRQLAEDLVAEAFTRAWTSWHKVSRHPAPRAWIVRTALNVRVSRWRRQRREVAWDGTHEVEDVSAGDSGLDPALLTALRRLPRRQREVLACRVFLDLDTAGTATVLGIAPGTVTAHLSRAVASLRAHLVDEEQLEVGP
ncbi:RNA polymerase sigma factor [Nucisporomicrobium flavum]|uniref:RNA polymerase sigma factor n=1 Tax=Nucisporomicrobium flavum TaxID=2785915 RepID=UPI0018F5B2F7|nr:sigma-70 family RNA polymerase sigma factor [Nucisporomicrobium flavum]